MKTNYTAQDLHAAIQAEQNKKTKLRSLERQIRQREHVLGNGIGSMPVSPGGEALMTHLRKILPEKFLPGNAGKLKDLQWPNFLPVPSFNLGTDPTIDSSLHVTQGVEIGQEAGFIVMAIGWFPWSEGTAGKKAPLSITVRSRQSSRQFNDNPIPIQFIGDNSHPLIFPVPLPVQAQNFIDVTLSTWVDAPMTLSGVCRHDFVLFGERLKEGQEFEFLKNYLKSL